MGIKQELVSKMLDATQYGGSKEAGAKALSASSYDLEPMQLYLRYKYGDSVRDDDFTASTAGSILQLGMDCVFERDENYKVAKRQEKTLSNGYVISGEVDLLDLKNKAIIDFKLLAGGGYKKAIKKESYIANMSIYRWLFDNEFPDSYLFCINKSGSAVRGDQYELVDLTDQLWDYDDVEQILLDKTNEIQYMINHPEEIPECDIYQYGRDKNKNPNKCMYYCSFSSVCEKHKQRMNKNNYHAFKKLI